MATALNWVVILLSIIMVAIILLQVRGTGATLFGTADSSFRVRRGFERLLFRGTIILAVIFTVMAVWSVRASL